MHQASPLLQAMSCPPLLLWDPVLENNSQERTSSTCPLAACASRDQKACSGEPPCRQERPLVGWRGAVVWTPCPVLPPSSSYLVFSTKARRPVLSRAFSDACTSLPSLISESLECQVETKPSFQTSLAKNNLVRLEACTPCISPHWTCRVTLGPHGAKTKRAFQSPGSSPPSALVWMPLKEAGKT